MYRRGISKEGKLYQCNEKPACAGQAHCFYSNFDWLFVLSKIVCTRSDEPCKNQKEIKNYQKYLK